MAGAKKPGAVNLFFDSVPNGRRAWNKLSALMNSTELAEVPFAKFCSLDLLEASGCWELGSSLAADAALNIFAIEGLPSDNMADWIEETWLHHGSGGDLLLMETNPDANDNDHALQCSFFRAVAMQSGRHFHCEHCARALPAMLRDPQAQFRTSLG